MSSPKSSALTEKERVLPTDEAAGSNVDDRNHRLETAGPADAHEESADAGPAMRAEVSVAQNTTYSEILEVDEWGVLGTMMKIFRCVELRVPQITVESLVAREPVPAARRRFVAARCFGSILKLVTRGFLKITKDQGTSAIQNIELGPRITKRDN